MSASEAMLDYLAEIYRLAYYQSDDSYISTSALAAEKHVTAPAVTRMVQRLQAAGYLEHVPYHGIKLTASGEYEALMTIRKHRLVERFLVDVMGLNWHEVHDASDWLGVAASMTVINRMEEMAGFPRRCPHGEPIPSADGHMPRVVDYPLTGMEKGTDYVVSRVNTHDADKLKYFGELGFQPGMAFRLVERAPFNGPLQLQTGGDTVHFLGYELAGVLRVCSQQEYDLV